MEKKDWRKFAETYRMAVDSSLKSHFDRGASGIEVEFNILDDDLKPVTRVGYGSESRSFADVLFDERIPSWAKDRTQREVFHWMIEFATKPYYSPEGAACEAKMLEGLLLNVLSDIGLSLSDRFHVFHGNLFSPVEPDPRSIPEGWSLAKKRYLGKCVTMFGSRLATAGIHTNHSLPETLLSWDFFHLAQRERESKTLVDFRNQAMMRVTRLLRPFCPLFIAVSAASPLRAEMVEGRPTVVLTAEDSNRLLTFPNPEALDVPYLYAGYSDYLRISCGLVRSGLRFGGNNWTPVRARSDVDPVNRIISTTSEQLGELYRRGLYSRDVHSSLEAAERALVIENLCAIVDLPMSRVEVRTDEGGDSLDLAVAKIVLKELLMLRIYGDPLFGRSYSYGEAEIALARENEHVAAARGLNATIESPFRGGRITIREWLGRTLADLEPLTEAMDYGRYLEPLREMTRGGPNPASEMRTWFERRLSGEPPTPSPSGATVVPEGLLKEWMEAKIREVNSDIRDIAGRRSRLGDEAAKLDELLGPFTKAGHDNPLLPVRIQDVDVKPAVVPSGGAVEEVLNLASSLVRFPSVTCGGQERPEDIMRCARFLAGFMRDAGFEVQLYDRGRYPAILAGFPGGLSAPVMLSGHFDVVGPDPNDTQFEPRIEGDYLWGRGAADMKTVVATFVVWMRRALRAGPPFPSMNLLLVGNEENGEAEPFGTPQILADRNRCASWSPEFMIVGERTGERGDELFGQICTENRGVVRLRIVVRGEAAHSGFDSLPQDIMARLIQAREVVSGLLPDHLSLKSDSSWKSSAWFPFLNVGVPGLYNITPDRGILGLEVRPIPQDNVPGLLEALASSLADLGMEIEPEVVEGGIVCPPGNAHLDRLVSAVNLVSGRPPEISRKLAGTSARFAPGGNAVIWGQSGIGPHSRNERHYIPSIEPYLRMLDAFAATVRGEGTGL
ncbi:MAG: M20/M25/M40 family metallo-hydrolase [Candidatus Aminicenantes bacterium]|nr:M20/M25/M40 family metallo-hydrolase [Candidatus Aminicenantes bacterium]